MWRSDARITQSNIYMISGQMISGQMISGQMISGQMISGLDGMTPA